MAFSICTRCALRRFHESRPAAQSMRAGLASIRESTSTATDYWSKYDRFPEVQTPEAARNAIALLTPRQRGLFLVELDRFREHSDDSDELRGNAHHNRVPDRKVLSQVMLANFIPFVGFGFLDNAIMILAGESIEVSLGAVFCISTMAAAALGNLVSDVAGMSLASGVESGATLLGLSVPKLSSEQLAMKPTRSAIHTGRTLGLTLGCIIGMFPLLFIGKRKSSVDKTGAETTDS